MFFLFSFLFVNIYLYCNVLRVFSFCLEIHEILQEMYYHKWNLLLFGFLCYFSLSRRRWTTVWLLQFVSWPSQVLFVYFCVFIIFIHFVFVSTFRRDVCDSQGAILFLIKFRSNLRVIEWRINCTISNKEENNEPNKKQNNKIVCDYFNVCTYTSLNVCNLI